MDIEVKRRPPCPDYDIRGTERWLEQMAARGYHLCEGHAFQAGNAYFIEGKPKAVRYRLDAAKKVKQNYYGEPLDVVLPDGDTLQMNEDFGWKYITYRGNFHIYRCEDPSAPEMHTDPQVHALALKQVTAQQRRHLIGVLLYGIIWCSPRGEFLCSSLINRGLSTFVPMVIFMALALVAWLPGMIHILRFRKALEMGILAESNEKYSEGRVRFQRTLRALPMIFILFSLWFFYQDPASHDGVFLDSPDALDVPIVTTQDLFPDAQIAYNDRYGTYITQWSTEASPENYELSESSVLTLPDGTCTIGDYDVQWHETAFDWIAYGYSLELQFLNWIQSWSFEDVTRLEARLEGADRFLVYSIDHNIYTEPYTMLILVKDNVVIKASLTLYSPDIPGNYTAEELGQALLDSIS